MFDGLNRKKRRLLEGITSSRRHNNRKRTVGRKAISDSLGGFRGYIPSKTIRLKKQIKALERAIEIFNSKPAQYRIENADKLLLMQRRLRIKNHVN